MSKKCKKKQIYLKPKMEKYGDISGITMEKETTGPDGGLHSDD